jgi:hypothetical protein
MNKSTETVDMSTLPMSERARLADTIGEQVGKVLNRAVIKCNKMLKKYGYMVSVTLDFHELKDLNE